MRGADGRDPVEARSRLQRRLADPLTVTLFAWLALPLGFAVERTRSLGRFRTDRDRLASASTTRCAPRARCSPRPASRSAAFTPWLLLAACTAFGGWRLARVRALARVRLGR